MQEITDYGKVFETLIRKTQDYIVGNNLSAMVLGISGGIDSTVVAAICHEVSKRTVIPLIGRSLPSKYNKEGETTAADLVGKAFCNDYKVFNINDLYHSCVMQITHKETGSTKYTVADNGNIERVENTFQTTLANGNIQARLRMIYLYNLASIHKGLVMDTDNLTENNLGYFTIHGDVGDFNPIGGLWKTEVFKLAEHIHNDYYNKARCLKEGHFYQQADEIALKLEAIKESLKLKPTAGLGITNNDLEEIGAESYDQVDAVLQDILAWKRREDMFAWKDREHPLEDYLKEHRVKDIPQEIIERVAKRHFASEFKRKQLPIKITIE
jgi:NAD+ synthetase